MTTETRTEITVTITPEESRLIIHALADLANFYSRAYMTSDDISAATLLQVASEIRCISAKFA